MTYSIQRLERHWIWTEEDLRSIFDDWMAIFDDLITVALEVAQSIQGRKALAENCTYLLLSKGINHSLATYTLITRGLLIDASLTARNALETFLMLELFVTDPTEKYFDEWTHGKEFKPAWVRKKLGVRLSATIRDVVITFDDDFYETVKMAYSFWSGVTHSNMKSAEYSIRMRSDGTLEVPTGGSVSDKNSFINCLFTIVCSGLIRNLLIASAVFSLKLLEEKRDTFAKLQTRINTAVKSYTRV